MKFLFHTLIRFDGVPVYYNVFKNGDQYFLQILHNPNGVSEAASFTLTKVDGKWKCSVKMSEREIEILGEEIEGKRT